jgi:hypothetical protein
LLQRKVFIGDIFLSLWERAGLAASSAERVRAVLKRR